MSTMKAISKRLLLLALVVSVVGCDRVSKNVATDVLAGAPPQSYFFDVVRLSYEENPGSFLSLGAGLPETIRFLVFTLGAGAALGLFFLYALLTRRRTIGFAGLGLFIAGGIANWSDRVADGRVVDFLNVGIGPIRTGIFNVADMAILAGALLLIFGEYWRYRKQPHATSRRT